MYKDKGKKRERDREGIYINTPEVGTSLPPLIQEKA